MLRFKELILLFSTMIINASCSDENCGPYFITSYEGTIKYPPVANFYTSPITCSWIIISPPNTVLTIRVKMLDIEKDPSCTTPNCCKHNWLSIPREGGRGTQQICGSNTNYPGTVALAQKRTVIKFSITKVIHGGKGFELDFSMDSEECPPGLILCSGARCMIRKHADKFCKRELCPGSNQVPCGGLTECYNNVTQRCDGKKDCPNGADELDCQCAHNMLPCYNGQGCYSFTQKCDSVPDCFDYTDELNCNFCRDGMAVCGPSDTRCFNPSTERCDGKFDCFSGEDELGCESYCQGQIACRNGFKCYGPVQRCNGISDCPDSSDEIGCSGGRLAQPICTLQEPDRFICANELCIPGRKYCDGKNDCGDLSDEVDCFRNSVIAAAIVGSLVCGLLLVIAAGCICRLYRVCTPPNSFPNNGLQPSSGCVGGVGIMHYRDEPPPPASPAAHEFYHREPPPAYSVAVQQQPPPRITQFPCGGPVLNPCAPDLRQPRPMGASETLPARRTRRHSRRHRSRRQHPVVPFEPAACCSALNGVGGIVGGSTPNINLNIDIEDGGFEEENNIGENVGRDRFSPAGGSTSVPSAHLVSPNESTSAPEVDPPHILTNVSQPTITSNAPESFINDSNNTYNSKPVETERIERNTSLIVEVAPPPPPEPARIFQTSTSTTSSSGSPSRESLTSSTSLVSYLSSNDETPLFANMQ